MGAKFSGVHDEPISEINIVPFVDIILVVLIIFMVTTPLIMKPSINVKLPNAASGENTSPSVFNLTLLVDGSLLLNGKPVSLEQVKLEAKALVVKKPATQAIISADKNISHGKVVAVIDAVKSVGVNKFAITTEKN